MKDRMMTTANSNETGKGKEKRKAGRGGEEHRKRALTSRCCTIRRVDDPSRLPFCLVPVAKVCVCRPASAANAA